MQQPFSWNARNTMRDSTAMEFIAATLALQWCSPIIHEYEPDVIQVLDNSASVSMVNTNKASAHAERVIAQARSDLLDDLPLSSLVVGVHVVRERIDEIDYLTKHDLSDDGADHDEFFSALSARFGPIAPRWALVTAPSNSALLTPMLRVTEIERRRLKRASVRSSRQ